MTSDLTGLVLTHDEKLLIATGGKSTLFLDPATGPVLSEIEGEPGDGSVYANVRLDDKTAFVSNERSHSISVIDVATRKVTGRIQVGNAPIALTFSPDGKLLYTTSQPAFPDWGWAADACEAENAAGRKHPKGAVVVIDV